MIRESYSKIPVLHVIARAENPLLFFELLKRKWAYILCMEPSEALLLGTGIVFRPIEPAATASLYFVKGGQPQHIQTADAFMDYVKDLFAAK